MNIAVIGGGINGLCIAWLLSKNQHQVTLYEKNKVMQATSMASSKLLHGGLRYLENGEFSLVKEALRERNFWIENAPQYAKPLKIFLPIYHDSQRSTWKVKIGLWLYDFLAGKHKIGKAGRDKLEPFKKEHPELKVSALKTVFHYYDGQMQDESLGQRVVEQLKSEDVTIFEQTPIQKITTEGFVDSKQYDRIINAAGPWAEQLLKDNKIPSSYSMDLVRGSHIVINKKSEHAYILEVPGEQRIFFVLPYNDRMLIGITEQRQTLLEKIQPSDAEIDYLLNAYNHYFTESITINDIIDSFAGLRPLIKSAHDPGKATREYAFEQQEKLITVFGGKWTTARSLAAKLVNRLEQYNH
ncbi:MAG: glycerol-3-phosphate dehydrogenase/oxidase [Gammaproteobacteria bacterium]|nr:glycerol-3-phosphate dehydrogenase/oxidase [Gammaproteobacteria bacterium]